MDMTWQQGMLHSFRTILAQFEVRRDVKCDETGVVGSMNDAVARGWAIINSVSSADLNEDKNACTRYKQ